MKKVYVILFFVGITKLSFAQVDSTLIKRTPRDTSFQRSMNMDAIYNRPFLSIGKLPAAIGGYVEADYTYVGTNGVTEGHSFSDSEAYHVYRIVYSPSNQVSFGNRI